MIFFGFSRQSDPEQKRPISGVEGGKVDLNLRKPLILRDLVKNGAKKCKGETRFNPETPLFFVSKSSEFFLVKAF